MIVGNHIHRGYWSVRYKGIYVTGKTKEKALDNMERKIGIILRLRERHENGDMVDNNRNI